MIILGIETSTRIGSVALADKGEILVEADLSGVMNHSEKLLPAIEKIMAARKIGFAEIGRIAVSTGPGSFTGLRIGLTVARTLAQMLRKKVVGIPTLDCLAAMVPTREGLICPLISAIQGQVYYALYQCSAGQRPKKITDYRLAPIKELEQDLKNRRQKVIFTGEALFSIQASLPQSFNDKTSFAAPEVWRPTAAWISLLGSWYKPQLWVSLVPYYIRPSEAEWQWQLNRRDWL
ncbi:MAG: tRNA (adenosine(37)-N6)-threonylcarbamoyltransferase complex dimerization subunit type 1 TsaB [Elusimicrobia bacterium]|nr:tRNA (adenosine(37)-N6)-threonylcarbamoyltransferase complex dimerization subunit type 1 TsaB [Elusimicrobiota bacterium]